MRWIWQLAEQDATTPLIIHLFAQIGAGFCHFQVRASSAGAVTARASPAEQDALLTPFIFFPSRLTLPFPFSQHHKQSSCLLQSQAEIGQRVFKGSHTFPSGGRQTGRLEETGAERSWPMLVWGSRCSFPLQHHMAGPILPTAFLNITVGMARLHGREGGTSDKVSGSRGSIQAHGAPHTGSWITRKCLSLRLNLNIWDFSCFKDVPSI